MTEIDLDSVGIRWVRESLDQGRALSELVLRRVPLDEGRCLADVPEDWPPDSVSTDFLQSGAPGGSQSQNDLFDHRARQLLSDGAGMVLEEEMWRPGDRERERAQGLPVIVESSRLLAYVPDGPIGPAEFVSRHSTGYPLNAFFVPLPEPGLPSTSAASWLPAAVAGLQAIVVAAWDAEGFIWWRRQPS